MIETAPAPTDLASPRPRWWLLLVVVLVVGAGGGVLTEWAQGVLDDPWAMWANSIAAWCLPAFLVGALARRPGTAVAAAVATEFLLVGSYYAAQLVQDLPVRSSVVGIWLVGGVLAGAVFGTAGAWWRRGDVPGATVGAALISGVLVMEGCYRAQAFPWQGASGVVMAVAGAVLALLLGRTWRQRAQVLGLLVLVVPLGWLGVHLVNGAFAAV
ncbi:hypothetical protein GCM10023328_40430 [Modestobacter marinus]|uniref:Uncharacterized protein n=1 Tax=Modestobacter marinus TaxID=477641 RepID=A0A846LQB5_9ACTN|nr:DUF6518 family protein [Modestobacter marinus]NIH68654.1 hypothetical protein [Modestobacter marinus]GGL59060.1 hypothetical protein GCM10011589_13760 [Modestobacter marinus]